MSATERKTAIDDGASLIAKERQRQMSVKGWTVDHDFTHAVGELTDAAICYAVVASSEICGSSAKEWPVSMFNGFNDSIVTWPFHERDYKPSDDPIRNLVKAGALIAAEIDRLQRLTARNGGAA